MSGAAVKKRRRKKKVAGAGSGAQGKVKVALARICTFSKADIQDVADLYKEVLNVSATYSQKDAAALTAAFESKMHRLMDESFGRIKGISDIFLRASEYVLAKANFYDVCQEALMKILDEDVANPALTRVVNTFFATQKRILAQQPVIIESMSMYYREQISKLKAEAGASASGGGGGAGGRADGGRLAQEELATRTRRVERVAADDESDEAETQALPMAGRRSRAGAGAGAGRGGGARRGQGGSGGRGGRGGRGASGGSGGRGGGERLPVTMTESFQRLTAPRMTPAERKAEEEARKAAEARKRPPPKFRPELKLKNLHALIEEIYASKQNYNKICEQSQLPYETMEEHVFTFLNQKYGLKRIIKGWLEGIRQGLVDYARDPDVKCFTYILNNELHEDYLFDYHYTIKRTTNQLLYAMLKLENPKVSDAEVTDLFQERLNDYVTEEEWIFLIQKIYEVPRDQERLVERVSAKIADDKRRAAAERKRAADLQPTYKSLRREEAEDTSRSILFKDFRKIILDYQLEGHHAFLADFTALYNEVWEHGKESEAKTRAALEDKWAAAKAEDPTLEPLPDAEPKIKGIINDEDFNNLVQAIDPARSHADIVAMLNEADPFETSRITYSQAVKVLNDAIRLDAMKREQGEMEYMYADDEFDDWDDGEWDGAFQNELITH